ncbi:MAG: cation transporter [Deltaproteobacteria bacterium]|nr:cation transporter [Deltaproteobacteria bacterium]
MAGHEKNETVNSALARAAFFTSAIFLIELIGGWLTNSLALMSDAAHVAMDLFALSLSLFAHRIAQRPATDTRTYGLHRLEIFASLINGLTLLLVAVFIFYKAYARFMAPPEVKLMGMLVFALAGLAVNLIVAFMLKGHAERDLNLKSAFYHVLGDAASSVGVVAGAIIIYATGFKAVDPIVSVLIGIIIMAGASGIIREASHILLEGVPKELDLNEVISDMKAIEGVVGVHSLHLWSICHNIHALSAHVDIAPERSNSQSCLINSINETLAHRHRIFYTTIQAECTTCDTGSVLRNIEHNYNHTH